MKSPLKILSLSAGIVTIGIQFVPVPARTAGGVSSEIMAPEDVKSILRRSCYDCHSNETTWPLYSKIAPVSWWVAHHVEEGRKELNFSTWDRYSEKKRRRKIEESAEQSASGEMPLKPYLVLHPSARLSSSDIARLREWAESVP